MAGNIQKAQKFTMGKRCHAALMLGNILILLLFSCSTEPAHKNEVKNEGFSQIYTHGAITLNLKTSKKDISIAEQIEVILEAAVPENIEVEFPAYSASLGDFTLKDTLILPARMTGSGDAVRVVRQTSYLLEPYLAGMYTIPAMTVTFREKSDTGEVIQLMTEEMVVDVKSLLPPDADRAAIKDIKPPLALEPDRVRQFLMMGLILLLASLVIAGFIYWKKRAPHQMPAEVQMRPEEIALQKLEKLLAENLLAKGEVKLFHLRISDILRQYIENRFGIKAPERTTEEFLVELSRTKSSQSVLLSSHKVLLADFLSQCDLVKFAKHEPTLAESEKTVVICRDFIEETKEKDNYE